MIIAGSQGSLVLFWNNLLISGFPLGYHDYDYYKQIANELIVQTLRLNIPMKEQIKKYQCMCEITHKRKKTKTKMCRRDHELFLASCLALVKLKIIDEEDVVFIAPRKKGS
jgi:hypothetical protein